MMNDSVPGSTEKQPQILDQILAIGQAIQQQITKNPKSVYQLIVEVACQMTGANCAVIYPYHPSFGEFYDLENVAAHGLHYGLQLEERADKRRRLAARIHREGEIVHENIDLKDPRLPKKSPFMTREEIKAFMGLSLKVADNVVGILYVDYREPHRFSEEEKRIIRLLGQQAALAVSNSWTFRLANIRAETVAKLKTVGQTLAAMGDPTKTLAGVLNGIARSAQEVLDADMVDLYQYVQARHEFILPPILVGERRYPDVAKAKIYDDDVAMTVVTKREPHYFHNAQETSWLISTYGIPRNDAPSQRFVVREEIVSSAIIPLIAAGETIGVMFVNYRTPQLFGQEQRDVSESFAAQAAIAIRNARLFQLEQEQRQQSETLRNVAQLVNSTLNREEVIGFVLDQLREVVEYNSASIQLIQGDRRSLIGGRGFLLTDSPLELLHNVSQDPLVSKIVQERRPLVLSNVEDEPLWDHIPQTARVNSWIGIPLIVGEQVIGLLTVDHKKAGYYTRESGEIVAAFANQAALAIRNAELYALEQRRNRDLGVLNQSAIKLSQILDAKQIYQALLAAIINTLECDYCTIFLAKADGLLVSHAAGGRLFAESPKLHFAVGEGLAGWVYQQGKPLIVGNTAVDKRYKRGPWEQEIKPRSMLLTPLRSGEKVIGVVSADFDQTNAFDEGHLRLLETLTLQASAVLQNIEFFNEFKVLHQAASELAKQPTLEQICETAVQSALATLYCRHSTIFILNKKAGRLVAVLRRGKLPEAPEVRHFILGEGLAGMVAQTGQSILVNDAANDERFIEGKIMPRLAPRSIILAPIKVEDEIIGVISADKDEVSGFTAHNLEILETLALDVGIAINLRRQIQQVSDQAQALTELNKLAQRLVSIAESPQDTRNLLEQVAKSAYEVLKADLVELYEYEQKQNEYRLPQISVGDRRGPLVAKDKIYEDDAVFQLIHRPEPLYVEAVQADAMLSGPYTIERRAQPTERFVVREGIQSTAAIQLRTGSETVGLMFASYRTHQEFGAEQRALIELFANQAAIAIQNSRLFNDLERRVEDLRALNEVGQKLTSGLRLQEDEILELIYEQAGKLTGTQDMYIALYDEATGMVRFGLAVEKSQRVTIEPRQANMERRGKTEEIIFTRRPLLHKTKQKSEDWYKLPGHQEFLGRVQPSYIGVPMMVGEKVLGMIAISDWVREYAYDELDLQVLSSMASQAAIALDNGNLYARRVRDVEALNKIGQTLTSGSQLRQESRLNEDEILELIYEQADKLTGTQHMYIALYDEATGTIRFGLAMEEGQRVTLEPRQADMERRGRTEEVIFTRQPFLHRTKQEAEAWYKLPGHQEFIGSVSLSFLGVPMMIGERVLGMIAVYDWEREYTYDELDLQVLSSMASQAAIALDNANLYRDLAEANQALARRVRALTALNEIDQTLTSGIRLTQDEILELIYEQARKLTDTQNIYIALYDDTTEMIRFGLAMERGQRVTIEPRPADMDHRGKTEEVIFTRQPLLHRTAQESRSWYDLPEHQKFGGHVQPSYLGVPMIVSEKVLGVIAVYDEEQEYAYDEQDAQVLSSMASQAAIALDNVELYQDLSEANHRLQRRIEQIQTVQQIITAVKTYADLPVLLQSILDVSLPPLKAQAGTIQLRDRTTNQLIMRAAVGSIEEKQHERISLDQGITGHAAREERTIYVADTSQDDRFLDYLGLMRSELAIPLYVEGEVIGVFNIEDPERDAFDEETCELAELIASQMAIFIQNTQRREELIANKQLTALGIATAAIQHRINNTLNIISPNITRLRKRVNLEDETMQEILELIERNTKNTTDYINRIQEPLKEAEIQAIDINACLHEAHARVREEYQGKVGFGAVEVSYYLDEALPLIEASSGQITEVFRNLIENGYKAMGADGGALTIVSRQVDGWLEVEIQDTGPGIPPEIQDRLFVKPVPSRQPGQHSQGSGLGLWLSVLLLQKYAGEIKITNPGPGGTTVLVRLPGLTV